MKTKSKTKYPVTRGTKVFYKTKDGKVKSGYAMSLGWFPGDRIGFLVMKSKDKDESKGTWIMEEDLR